MAGTTTTTMDVSAFISNHPGAAKTVTRTATNATVNCAGSREAEDAVPNFLNTQTRSFGTKDAFSLTLQAAIVIKALESGALALLVDKDVSIANFMACNGRMRTMIMDEPIMPLLYRVNGLFLSKEHNMSTVLVVRGVGEWLDVANAGILMRDNKAHDGLAKARSISYQFLHRHVQYTGRGIVHCLPWKLEEGGEMNRRRDIENGNDDCDDEGDNKPSLSSQMLLTTTMNATLSLLRRRP
jgi:predicted ABC-class ATPase